MSCVLGTLPDTARTLTRTHSMCKDSILANTSLYGGSAPDPRAWLRGSAPCAGMTRHLPMPNHRTVAHYA